MPRFRYEPAPDVAEDVSRLVDHLEFQHIDPARIHCRRSWGSTSEAYARIWELPGMWQECLGVPAQYIIEVLGEHYDELDRAGRLKILIHELLHIPRTFSGALRNHSGHGERINDRTVNRYYSRYEQEAERRAAAASSAQLSLPFTLPASPQDSKGTRRP